MEKTCFVIMGFGKKMDYRNSKRIDLDIIYQKVIKELFSSEFTNYKLIRADEISGSEIIDISMYTLLMKADLVIADITTMNENALYELGIRHALRPFSTIIMLQNSDKAFIPFDLSHNRILTYADYGDTLDDSEAAKIKSSLSDFIIESEKQKVDSPFYTYLADHVVPAKYQDETYTKILEDAMQNENTVAHLLSIAEKYKNFSDFAEALPYWQKLHKMLPNNTYITQQLALAHYKSEIPNKSLALQNALYIINSLTPQKSLDLETLGIAGAIYKRLYSLNENHYNFDYLDEAIKMYQKGFIIQEDYYTGENYANCLLFKTAQPNLTTEKINSLKLQSKEIYQKLISLLSTSLSKSDTDYWKYATLSTSYYCIGDNANHIKYQKLFFSLATEWEKESYNSNLNEIKKYL